MHPNNVERKRDICKRAKAFHHTQIFVPGQDQYVIGVVHKPDGFCDYKSKEMEPIVSPCGIYDLDPEQAWLTVNRYNALVLNTRNMLIADIDFGDERLNQFAGAKDCANVMANLKDLQRLDNEQMMYEVFKFANQSYRLYRTHSGCRVICTSACFPWAKAGWAAQRFMRFLRSDPEYIKLCTVQQCYRARLTPKPWRQNGEPAHVCVLESTIGNPTIAEELRTQLALHDELTLREADCSHLA
jgi:hypothetical protein